MIEETTKRILIAIVKHCDIIEQTKAVFGSSYSDYEDNIIYQNAILTPVSQIGELVKRLSDIFRQQYKEIPWRSIAGLRDIVVHSYETIDKVVLWDIVNDQTGKLGAFCAEVLKK